MARRSHGRRKSRILRQLFPSLLLLPVIVLLTGVSWAGAENRGATPEPMSTSGHGGSPIADWVEDVDDEVDDADDDLNNASLTIGTSEGPLSEPDLSSVEARLDHALAAIDRILDPNQSPSLDPPDAGTVDTSVNPTTLQGYARECLDRIRDAGDELDSSVVDAKVVGTHLRTIRHLITRTSPHSYRSKAGITSGGG
jgi:hypothetical protein